MSNQKSLSDRFSKLESQLKSLLAKVSSTSSSFATSTTLCDNNFKIPPDEANFALGKQIAIIYVDMLLQCCSLHNHNDTTIAPTAPPTTIATVTAAKSRSISSSHGDKLKSKWKELGTDMVQDTFINNSISNNNNNVAIVAHDALITAFFHSLHNELCHHITTMIHSKCDTDSNYNPNEDEYLASFLDDICYWWIGIIGIIDSAVNASSTLFHSSITYYLKFAYNTFIQTKPTTSLSSNISNDYGDHLQLIRLYYKIQNNNDSNPCFIMIQHLITTMFYDENETCKTYQVDFISPLLAKLVKNCNLESWNISLLIKGIIRESSLLIYQHDDKRDNEMLWNVILPWFINTCFKHILSPLLLSLSSSSLDIDDLFRQLCELVTAIVSQQTTIIENTNERDDYSDVWKERTCIIQNFIDIACSHIYNKASSASPIVQPFIVQINNLLLLCHDKRIKFNVTVSNQGVYHLMIATLLSNDQHYISSQLKLLSTIVTIAHSRIKKNKNCKSNSDNNNSSIYSPMIWAALNCIGHIFMTYGNHPKTIVQVTTVVLTNNNNNVDSNSQSIGTESYILKENKPSLLSSIRNIYFQFSTKEEQYNVLASCAKEVQSSKVSYTTIDQCDMVLFGLSLLVQEIITDNGNDNVSIYSFLSTLISALPHLGRRSLPVLKVLLHHLISNNKSSQIQSMFEFICKSVVYDASCAHEVWTFIASLINPSSASIKVQSMVLRLYPLLCNSNKRLYGRICQSLGTYNAHPNAELRVVTASTLCELAKLDLIRDVTDVIGWLQSYLNDEEDMIVYFAILALHYLVVSGELDYIIVLKVLNKKLVKLDDESIDEILNLSPIVIEAVMKFLGDGAIENDDDSSRGSDDERQYEKSMPAHISLSISTLCQVALHERFLPAFLSNQFVDDIGDVHILNEIFNSLSNYSIDSFGIDEDLICVEDGHDNSYTQLKRVIDSGTELVSCCDQFSGNDQFAKSVKDLASKLEEIECKSPVAMRWIQEHRVKVKKT